MYTYVYRKTIGFLFYRRGLLYSTLLLRTLLGAVDLNRKLRVDSDGGRAATARRQPPREIFFDGPGRRPESGYPPPSARIPTLLQTRLFSILIIIFFAFLQPYKRTCRETKRRDFFFFYVILPPYKMCNEYGRARDSRLITEI